MQFNRPKIKIQPTRFDKLLDTIAYILLFVFIGFAIYFYTILPDIIPTHFDIKGNVNDRGSKNTIWILVFINVAIFFGCSFLAMHPHLYNYPMHITDENAERQYRNASRLIRTLKVMITLTFTIVLLFIYNAATNVILPYSGYVLPFVLTLIFIPIAIYFFRVLKK